jgi:hypothetical protein
LPKFAKIVSPLTGPSSLESKLVVKELKSPNT